MQSSKLIDIIIPAYKAHNTLPRLLASLLSQKSSDLLEITIVNDWDTKDYKDVIKAFPLLSVRELNYLRMRVLVMLGSMV